MSGSRANCPRSAGKSTVARCGCTRQTRRARSAEDGRHRPRPASFDGEVSGTRPSVGIHEIQADTALRVPLEWTNVCQAYSQKPGDSAAARLAEGAASDVAPRGLRLALDKLVSDCLHPLGS